MIFETLAVVDIHLTIQPIDDRASECLHRDNSLDAHNVTSPECVFQPPPWRCISLHVIFDFQKAAERISRNAVISLSCDANPGLHLITQVKLYGLASCIKLNVASSKVAVTDLFDDLNLIVVIRGRPGGRISASTLKTPLDPATQFCF